ncbi:hypothetical protein PLESTM_000962600 [Pleodorina starrii]|nr:hypothetical protein PLESTM_000962600 [Pleodorina starrii]
MEPTVKVLSGAAMLTVMACIARIGFASFIAVHAWGEACQAAALVFLLRFGEHLRIASTEVILGIVLGAAVGALSALVGSCTAAVLALAVAMILIHHPCPGKYQSSEPVATHAAPSLGFWQLLLATFVFVYRSAAGSGLRGCLSAAFAHIVMLAAAVELLTILSAPGQVGGAAATDDDGAELLRDPYRTSHGSLAAGMSAGALSPTARAGPGGSRHGAGSPPPACRSSGAQLAARSPTNGAGAAHRSRCSSLPPFLEVGEQELAHPPTGQRIGDGPWDRGGGGGGGAITTRASCPVVPYRPGRPAAPLLRSASAAAVGAQCNNNGGGAAAAAAVTVAGVPSGFAISTSPIRWSAGGRSRVQNSAASASAGCGVQAAGGFDRVGLGEQRDDDSLPDGLSPDSHSSRAHQQQRQRSLHSQQKPLGVSRSSSSVARAAAATAEGRTDADCGDEEDARRTKGSDRGQDGAEEVAVEGEAAQRLQPQEPWAGGEGGTTDPRVGAAGGGDGEARCRYRRETGNSTHEYILLASTTLPGTDGDGAAGYESGFSSDDEEDDKDDDDEEEEEYDSELYRDYDMDDMDGGVSDGCFSLVIDNNGAPLGDCMVGVNRTWRTQMTHGSAPANAAAAAVAAAVAAWVDAGAAAAATDEFKGPAAGACATGPVAHCDGVRRDPEPSVECTRLSSRPRKAAARHQRWCGGGGGPSASPLNGPLVGAHGVTGGGGGGAGAALMAAAAAADRARGGHGTARQHLDKRAVVRHIVRNPYCCDVADLADFDDEDLMSLEEPEAIEATAAAAGSIDEMAASARVAAARGQPDASTLQGGSGGGGGEDRYSHWGVYWPSSSAVTSEVRLKGGSPLLQTRQHQCRKSSLGGLRGASAASCGASGVGGGGGGGVAAGPQGAGGEGDGAGGGWAGASGGGEGRLLGVDRYDVEGGGLRQRPQIQDPACGDVEWRGTGSVPLQAVTLAAHLAAIKAHEMQLLLQERAQQQQQQGAAKADEAEEEAEEEAAWPGLFPAAAGRLGLLDSFLRDAALLARADAKPRRSARRRDSPGAHRRSGYGQQQQRQRRSYPAAATVEEGHQGHEGRERQPRARGRRPTHRKLSAGQLLAREVISRYDQEHRQRYGNTRPSCHQYAYPADQHNRSQVPADESWPLPPQQQRNQQQQQQRGRLPDSAAVAALPGAAAEPLEHGALWDEGELLQTFELSGLDEPHLGPLPPLHQQQHQHQHQHGEVDEGWTSQPADPATSLAARVWGWLGPPGSPHATVAAAAELAASGTCAWRVPVTAASAPVDWCGGVSSGGGWGGGGGGSAAAAAAAAALRGSPQQLRCATAASPAHSTAAAAAAAAAAVASAPTTPPTTLVEPFSAVGQAVYRSLSGNRRYEEVDRRRGISDNYKAALAAAAAAGSRSGPTTPGGGSRPPESPLAAAGAAVASPTAASKSTDRPLAATVPSPQTVVSGQEAAAAAAAAGEARRRLPGGASVGRALFLAESVPLSEDHGVAPLPPLPPPRGGGVDGGDVMPAAARKPCEQTNEPTAAAAAAAAAVEGASAEALDVQGLTDEAMVEGEAAEGRGAASGSTSLLSRLTIPSEL